MTGHPFLVSWKLGTEKFIQPADSVQALEAGDYRDAAADPNWRQTYRTRELHQAVLLCQVSRIENTARKL